MTREEFERCLTDGRAIAFDTNAVWGKVWQTACGKLRHWCFKQELKLHLVVSALVHEEKIHDLAGQFGEKFDLRHVSQDLETLSVSVEPFGQVEAERTARWLTDQFPSNDAWQQAKRRLVLGQLGLVTTEVSANRGCGATVDWFIAGHAQTNGWLLVTSDRGLEFERLDHKISLDDFVAHIDIMLGEA